MNFKSISSYAVILCSLLVNSCDRVSHEQSDTKVTYVNHTPIKRQSIGNCWLYAKSTWLESMLKVTTGKTIKVSETYWTYWDFYWKLRNNIPLSPTELNTAGSWRLAKNIVNQYGWVEEKHFISAEAGQQMSEAQKCALDYIDQSIAVGGVLHDAMQRSPELIRSELDKGFSCNGKYQVDMASALQHRQMASKTILLDIHTGERRTLTEWLEKWIEVDNNAHRAWSYYEGKKLPSLTAMKSYRMLSQRIKKALNDHQPVVLSFYVSFNAPNEYGLFNLNTFAKNGSLGESGGHLIVLHDYTVNNVAGVGRIGEGDMSDEMKAQALTGDLDYLVAKNSWGANRIDRPWLRDGYSRLSWKYLTSHYYDEERGYFYPFLTGVVLPPGY